MGYVVVLKELICTVSTLGGCSNVERTVSSQLLLLEGMVVMKELSYLTVSTLGECSNLERTDF